MSSLAKRWHWFIRRLAIEAGFRFVYPTLARLPARLGLAATRIFGHLMYVLDCDWRTVSLRQHFVAEKTSNAFSMISPLLDAGELAKLVRERFICATCEELEGYWLRNRRLSDFPVKIDGLDAVQKVMDEKRGLVLLTFHFDAAIWGISCLGRAGLTINAMSSNVVEDARVPPVVQDYFRAKYIGLSSYLNGGLVMHQQKKIREFYRRLRMGQAVVVLADASAQDSLNAVSVDFLGNRRAFASGAMRLAERTGAALAAFVCLRTPNGHHLVISPPVQTGCATLHHEVSALFAFLEAYIRQSPEKWWAADLLSDFSVISNEITISRKSSLS